MSDKKIVFNPFDLVEDTTNSLNQLSPTLRVIFKKLLKSEQTTKIKGLEELGKWIVEDCSGEEEFLQCQKHLVKVYQMNVVHVERQIRESTNFIILSIVNRDKRWISPIAKDLFFAWFGSILDPVGSVSSLASDAFKKCFNNEKIPEVCKFALKSVISKSIEIFDSTASTNFELSHALCSIQFLISNLSDDDLSSNIKIIQQLEGHFDGVINNGNLSDLGVRRAFYSFFTVSSRRKINFHQTNTLIALSFDDLGTVIADEVLILIKSQNQLDPQLKNSFLEVIGRHLPKDIPKNVITKLNIFGDDPKFCALLKDYVWKCIDNFKSLDLSRLSNIWELYLQLIKDDPDAIQRAIVKASESRDLRKLLFSSLFSINSKVFEQKLLDDFGHKSASLPPLDQFNLALDCCPIGNSVTQSYLIDKFSQLSLNYQIDNLFEALSRVKDEEGRTRLLRKVIETSEESREAILKVFKIISDKCPNMTPKIIELVKPEMTYHIIELALSEGLLNKLAESLNVNDKLAEFILNGPPTPTGCFILLRYCQQLAPFPILLCHATSSHLWPLFEIVVNQKDQISAVAALSYSSLITGRLDELNCPTEFLVSLLDRCFMIMDESLIVGLVSYILDRDHSLWNNVIEKCFGHKLTNTISKMKLHMSQSIALSSYPLAYAACREKPPLIKWEEDIRNIQSIFTALRYALLVHEGYDLILVLSTWYICLKQEAGYFTNSTPLSCNEGDTLLKSLTEEIENKTLFEDQSSDLVKTLGLILKDYGGFFWVFARLMNARIVPLKPLTDLSFVEFSLIRELPSSIDYSDVEHCFYAMVSVDSIKFHQSDIYQILSTLKDTTSFSPEKRFIFTKFILRMMETGSVNAEYWSMNYPDMMDTLITENLTKLSDPEHVKTEHLFIIQTIKICFNCFEMKILKDVVLGKKRLIWDSFEQLSLLDKTTVLESLLQAISNLVVLMREEFKHIKTDNICQLLFTSNFLSVKAACRTLIIQDLDNRIELAKVKLSTLKRDTITEEEAFEIQREELIIPWRILQTVLNDNGGIFLNKLIALDLFLCLAEGSREVSILVDAFSNYFKDKLVTCYLPLLADSLGWYDGEEVVDLSKMEFTIIEFDSKLSPYQYAANLMYRCLKLFPSIIRSWFGNLASKAESLDFQRYCTNLMSPLLIERELSRIRKSSDDRLQFRIEQSKSICSVMVQYRFEEFSFSISLSIPPEYPLKPITFTSGERLGISEPKWRSWLLTIRSLLNQNLSVFEVIKQWRSNAERTLEGVEACSICYCVLQPGDRSLPGPSCKTCKNKFHSACLYKWFKTGGQATCPMCRSLF